MEETKKIKKSRYIKSFLISSTLVILLVVSIIAIYFYMQYRKTQQLLKNPTFAAQQQTENLVSQVGKLIALPTDEQPTIATVSDISKLSGQPFFQYAKNGDKVLIYTKARKAILYDPKINKIIEVAPVNLGDTTPVKQLTPTIIPTKSTVPTTSPTPETTK